MEQSRAAIWKFTCLQKRSTHSWICTGEFPGTYRARTCVQHEQNSSGCYLGGVWGCYLRNSAVSRGGQNIPELPGRAPEEQPGMDLPPTYTNLTPQVATLEESGAATCEIQLSPEETQTLLEMPPRSPRELQGRDLTPVHTKHLG